jgi:tetratricopeptide (TPR) repeat protein
MALTRDLPELVRLAVINGLHDQGPFHPLIGLTVAKAPQDEGSRRTAMDAFFEASLTVARATPASEAAVHYSFGNFYRSQGGLARAALHYNRARHLRPAYLQAGYFHRELGGVFFLASHYAMAQRCYREALRLDPDDPITVFVLGDALLLSGAITEARATFEDALARCTEPHMLREAALKIAACDHLITTSRSDTVPRRRYEASSRLRPDGGDRAEDLEYLVRHVDAFHPLASFNLGIARAGEGDRIAALHHFLACAFVQPQDIAAWANAAICALSIEDEDLLLLIMSTAIRHIGANAYDHFRANIASQGMPSEALTLFDKLAMSFLEERECSDGDGFTVRMLDGDDYHAMTIHGLGEA